MKIILIGASGQLGREWQLLLENEGTGSNIEYQSYDSTQLDITHYQEISDELRRQKPDVVVNCAAYTNVDGAEEHRKKAHKVNVEAVLYLAELSNELEFTLVHYSTDYVFPGDKGDRNQFPDGYPEDYPVDPINWYGKTKWEGEQAVRHTTGDHLIVRTSWLCGQFGNNFVKKMLKLATERDSLQVVDDQYGSPSFAENVAFNSMQLLTSGEKGTYHLTTNGLISWYDFAREIFEQRGIQIALEAVSSTVFPTRAKRPHFSKLSTEKAESVPACDIIDWEKGLVKLLDQLSEG